MTHLGDRVSALVDGQLDPQASERAHAHLASCRPCRDAVETERLLKTRLRALQGPDPESAFVGRLLALGGPEGPLPPREGHVPGSPRPAAVPLAVPRVPVAVGVRPSAVAAPGRTRPAGRRLPARPGSRRPRPSRLVAARRPLGRRARLAVAVAGALSMVGVGATVVGLALAPAGPAQVVPPVDSFVLEHSATTTGLTFDTFDQVPAGWGTAPGPASTGTAAERGAGGR